MKNRCVTLFWGLSVGFGLSGCASLQKSPPEPVAQARFVSQLPAGAQCAFLETIEVLDGNNCMAAGINQQGQESILRYNVLQKARKRGANTVIPGEIVSQQAQGCPNSGLSMRAQLYRCDYAN